jgi:copper chaperone CopZ
MRRITAEIERLTFEHSCVGLARQLQRRPGITQVEVDTRADRATITYDDTRLSVSQLERLIGECGYECLCSTPASKAVGG